ncbi:MAG: NUDIX hydrolase [Clostridiales Family XIII bacterium]|nr:NUDIX hydrolase [Clostridiales Family XIII bacterium]
MAIIVEVNNMWTGGARVIIVDADGGGAELDGLAGGGTVADGSEREPRILLVRQRHEGRDIWMPPGGAVEPDENSRDAAAREVLEETGLAVKIGHLLWHVEEVSEKRGQRFVNFFLGTITGGCAKLGTDPELGDNQVLADLKFFSKKEITEIEHVYPDFLRNEIWGELTAKATKDPYRIR